MCLFSFTATTGASTLQPYFLPFVFAKWKTVQTGILQSIMYGSSAFGLFLALPLLAGPRIGCSAKVIILLANIWQAFAWTAFGAVGSTTAAYLTVACFFLNGIWWPTFRATVTSLFGESKYGEALAAVATMQQLCATLSPPIFLQLWKWSLQSGGQEGVVFGVWHTGIAHANARVPFALVAIMTLAAVLVGLSLPRRLEDLGGDGQAVAGHGGAAKEERSLAPARHLQQPLLATAAG